jgi:lipoprotein signal peptidase
MRANVHARRIVLVIVATSFATVDVLHKLLSNVDVYHSRTHYAAIVMSVLIVGLVLLVPELPSTAASLGAGVACGGALGNLVSLLAWSKRVPDPLILALTPAHALAFNLADVFAVAGDALLLSAVLVLGLHRRASLRANVEQL